MDVKVLGTGCAKCQRLYAAAEQAIAAAGVPATLAKVETLDEIMKLRVLVTPALVIDGVVKCAGRVPGAPEIVAWLTTAAGRSG
jgi:small redox-active disulfide protein 2